MTKLFGDTDKFGDQNSTPVVEAFHLAVRALVRRKFAQSGKPWRDFVFGDAVTNITQADFQAIDAKLLSYGHRYVWSAVVSQQERPEAYLAGQDAHEAYGTDYKRRGKRLDETLAVKRLRLPSKLERQLSTTNAIENLMGSVRRLSRRVKRWRGGKMILRWTVAAVADAATRFRRVTGAREGMTQLMRALARHENAAASAVRTKAAS